MKNNKVKVRKGMTLIEVIISVALLSILIVPLSTMVTTSLKNKEEASDKQKATYIGQKILEELKSYDYITLKRDSNPNYFELLDNERIELNTTLNSFTGSFQKNIFGTESEYPFEKLFNVEVNINKDDEFKNDLNYVDETLAGYRLTLKNNSIYYEFINEMPISFIGTNDIVSIEINNDKLTLDNGSTNKEIVKESGKNNILIINLEDNYNQLTNLEVRNLQKNLSGGNIVNEPLEIILIKSSRTNNSVNIFSIEGDILVKEINLDDNLNLKDTYNYEVIVKDKNNKELFRGKSSSKLIIK